MAPHISREDYTEFHESIEELRAGRAEEQETAKCSSCGETFPLTETFNSPAGLVCLGCLEDTVEAVEEEPEPEAEKFSTDGKNLFVYGRKVLKAWESFSGWYWFAVEKVRDQESDLGDGKGTPDTIWFGYVQGFDEEWGDFSEAEIRSLGLKAWPIKKCDLPISGRRN